MEWLDKVGLAVLLMFYVLFPAFMVREVLKAKRNNDQFHEIMREVELEELKMHHAENDQDRKAHGERAQELLEHAVEVAKR